jgi:hypothetical protein
MPTSASNFQFTDYAQQLQNVERRRKLAEALMQQGLEPVQGQPAVGGIVTPISPLAGLAQMAKLGVGAYGMSQAEKKTEEISKRRQEDLANALRSMNVPENKLPATMQMLNMPETAGMGQSQIQMQMLKNAMNPQSPQSGMQQTGGQPASGPGMPGTPPAPIDLLGAGDMGKTVYEAINKFNAPVNVRPGGTVYIPGQGPQFTAPTQGVQTVWGPNGPVAGAVPGAQEATARGAGLTAGAQEAGKAPYELTTLQTAPAPTLMTKEQAIQAATGRPLPTPGFSGQGGKPGLKLQDQGAAAEQRKTGEALGDYTQGVMKDAAKAGAGLRQLANMELAVRDFTPGKIAPLQSSLIQWAQSTGLPLTKADERQAGSIQALSSMAIKMAGTATRESDAQPSQLQYMKILESMPNETRTIDGFQKIMAYLKDVHNYTVDKNIELQKWRNQYGTSDGFEAVWPKMAAKMPYVWNTQGLGNKPSGNVVDWNKLGR